MVLQNQGFPQINTPLVDKNGIMTQSWFKLMLSLWNRTGAGQGEVGPYVPDNVAISGGSINGTVIGDRVPAAGTFTNLRVTVSFSASNFSGASSGINTGNVTVSPASENYLSISNQVLTAMSVNLGTSNVTGTLPTANLTTVNLSPGTYANATVTVNSKGLVTTAIAGATPVTNGTYTVGLRLTGGGTDGKITVVGGIITAIIQAT